MKKHTGFLIAGLAAVFLGVLAYRGNNVLEISTYALESKKLPPEFDGLSIVNISDLHNKRFGKKQHELLGAIKELSPNLIVMTGDALKRNESDFSAVTEFVRGAVKIAPVIFVPGNHEDNHPSRRDFYEMLSDVGVTILLNDSLPVEWNGSKITVWGLRNLDGYVQCLHKIKDSPGFNVVLSHRPDRIELYARSKADLVLCGHAHGGQIRFFDRALFAPNQGFFPKYADGAHRVDETTMVISRGLGSSSFPFRMFNNPEIVEIVLKTKFPD